MRGLAAFLSFTAVTAAQAPRPNVPIDNEWARVILASNTPGQKSRLHKHDVNRVMIHLDAGVMRLAFQDSGTKEVKFQPGDVRWDPSGGLHTSENVGGTNYHIVEVEIKKQGAAVVWPEKDPRKVAPGVYALEFENEQVRVLRVKLPAGGRIPQHHHVVPRVVVPLTEVSIEVSRDDGTKAYIKGKPGDALFGRPDLHREENQLSHPVELILVELKSAL
jgi:quercetin dioxygenase-like cupin family protein